MFKTNQETNNQTHTTKQTKHPQTTTITNKSYHKQPTKQTTHHKQKTLTNKQPINTHTEQTKHYTNCLNKPPMNKQTNQTNQPFTKQTTPQTNHRTNNHPNKQTISQVTTITNKHTTNHPFDKQICGHRIDLTPPIFDPVSKYCSTHRPLQYNTVRVIPLFSAKSTGSFSSHQ